MRRFLLSLSGFLLVVLGLGWLLWSLSDRRDYTMPDGSIIRVEKVSYGKQEDIKLGGPTEKLRAMLPPSWQAKLGVSNRLSRTSSWFRVALVHTNEDALYIYISRSVPGKGYRSVDARRAEVVDEDGCVFESMQNGGYDDGRLPPLTTGGRMGYSVGWFRFEAFPRREKKFRLLVYDSPGSIGPANGQTNCAEFVIENPDRQPRIANWRVAPLPLAQTQDGVSFILTKVRIQTQTNGHPLLPFNLKWRVIQADYAFTEDGQPSTNWQAVETDLYDSSSNFISGAAYLQGCLCPREPAWKMRVRFFGSQKSRAASNAVWTLRGVAVPAPGQFTVLKRSEELQGGAAISERYGSGILKGLDRAEELQGVAVRAVAFAGAGDFTYSNSFVLEATPPKEPITNDSARIVSMPRNWTGKHSIEAPTFRVKAKGPHLAVDLGDLSEDQRFTVRAVDDQGREFYGHKMIGVGYRPTTRNKPGVVNYLDNWYKIEGNFLFFDLPADAKTVDLTFCVHTCRTVEFIFKPPTAPPSPGK